MSELSKEMTIERRQKDQCLKLDTFSAINQSLKKIEEKIDDLSDEMRTMIKLETQVIQQNKEIERLNKIVDDLRQQLTTLSSDFQSQKSTQSQSISLIERAMWAAGTIAAIIIGNKLGIS